MTYDKKLESKVERLKSKVLDSGCTLGEMHRINEAIEEILDYADMLSFENNTLKLKYGDK